MLKNVQGVMVIAAAALLTCGIDGTCAASAELDPRLVEIVREGRYEAVFPKSFVAKAWPAVTKWWDQSEEATFGRVFEGSPLKPGVRLLTVVPVRGIPSSFGLLLQVGRNVEPLNNSSTAKLEGYEAAMEANDLAWDRIQEQLATPSGGNICTRPAEEVARFYAFLMEVIRYYAPQSVLLTRSELARPGRPWLDDRLRQKLEPYLLDLRWRSYRSLRGESCLLSFRTWKSESGEVFEWLGSFPFDGPDDIVRVNLALSVEPQYVRLCRGRFLVEESPSVECPQ